MSERERDELLEQIAAGELDDEELGALRALAEDDALLEALRPLDDSFAERTSDRIVAELAGARSAGVGAGESARADSEASRAATGSGDSSEPPARVVPLAPVARPRSRRRAAALALASGLALAAAIALVVLRSGGEILDGYALSLGGGVAELRGVAPTPRSVPRYAPSSPIEIVLAPPTRTDVVPELALFVVRGEHVERRPVHAERSESGALRVAGTASQVLGTPPGRVELALAVGAPLPSERELLRRIRARDPRLRFAEVELLGAPRESEP